MDSSFRWNDGVLKSTMFPSASFQRKLESIYVSASEQLKPFNCILF